MAIKNSIIVDPLWDTANKGEQSRLLYNIISNNFFDVVEIWDTLDNDVLSMIEKYSSKVEFDVSLSPLMNEHKYNLTSNRKNINIAINYLRHRITSLSNIGVKNISLSSPIFDLSISRQKQVENFCASLKQVCDIADKHGIQVCFEAFDVFADKKRLLGTSLEIYKLFQNIDSNNLHLTWDLGHICLNRENYIESLELLKTYIKRVHISNFSFDKNDNIYGDKHLPFDKVGNIKCVDIKRIVDYIQKTNLDISMAFEVASNVHIKNVETSFKSYKYVCSLVKQYVNGGR